MVVGEEGDEEGVAGEDPALENGNAENNDNQTADVITESQEPRDEPPGRRHRRRSWRGNAVEEDSGKPLSQPESQEEIRGSFKAKQERGEKGEGGGEGLGAQERTVEREGREGEGKEEEEERRHPRRRGEESSEEEDDDRNPKHRRRSDDQEGKAEEGDKTENKEGGRIVRTFRGNRAEGRDGSGGYHRGSGRDFDRGFGEGRGRFVGRLGGRGDGVSPLDMPLQAGQSFQSPQRMRGRHGGRGMLGGPMGGPHQPYHPGMPGGGFENNRGGGGMGGGPRSWGGVPPGMAGRGMGPPGMGMGGPQGMAGPGMMGGMGGPMGGFRGDVPPMGVPPLGAPMAGAGRIINGGGEGEGGVGVSAGEGGGRLRVTVGGVGAGLKQRCPDFEEKGFCLKGDLCPFDHGSHRIVVEDMQVSRKARWWYVCSSSCMP